MRIWRSVVYFCLLTAGVVASAVGNGLEKGSGNLTMEERAVGSFNAIDADLPLDLYVAIGTKPSVTVVFDDNLCSAINAEVRDGILYLTSETGWSTDTKGRVEVTLEDLTALTVSGIADVYVHSLEEHEFKVIQTGMGTVFLDGTTKDVEIVTAGMGSVRARDLIANNAYVESRGSGNVEVYARMQFSGITLSNGSIDYYGRPEYRLEHASTEGEIRRR